MTIGTYVALDLIGSGILILGVLIGVRLERLGLTSYLRSKFQRQPKDYTPEPCTCDFACEYPGDCRA